MMITVATVRFAYTYRGFERTINLTSAFRNRNAAQTWAEDYDERKLEAFKQAEESYDYSYDFTIDNFELDFISLQDLYLN